MNSFCLACVCSKQRKLDLRMPSELWLKLIWLLNQYQEIFPRLIFWLRRKGCLKWHQKSEFNEIVQSLWPVPFLQSFKDIVKNDVNKRTLHFYQEMVHWNHNEHQGCLIFPAVKSSSLIDLKNKLSRIIREHMCFQCSKQFIIFCQTWVDVGLLDHEIGFSTKYHWSDK